jgi:GPI mannosyltransferase 3
MTFGFWPTLRGVLAGENRNSSTPNTPLDGADKALLAAILILALLLRVGAAIWYPSVHHPDETFQYWEQGHRFAFGFGMVPWEYRTGIRSYLVPGILAGVMKLVSMFGGGVAAWTVTVQVLLSLLSLSIVATAFAWGRRVGGRNAALLAAILTGIWFEFVYFGAKPLTESIAAGLLFPAAYLLCVRHERRSMLVWGGVLLGLAFVVRFQLLPAVLLIALSCLVVNGWRQSLPAALAALAVTLASGLLDWLTLGTPFQSVWLNFVVNAVEGKADTYGVEPPQWFLFHFAGLWAGLAMLLVVLMIAGVRRAPILLLVAAVILLAHSAVGHKEYRFVFPALPFVFTLAAIGAARIVDSVTSTYADNRARWVSFAIVVAAFALTSLNLATQPFFRYNWFRAADGIEAFRIAWGVEQACGIGLSGWNWVDTPGYRGLGRDLPIYPLPSDAVAQQLQPAFNMVVRRGKPWQSLTTGYQDVGCSGQICVAVREGACTPSPENTVNPFLVRKGE